MSSTTSTVRAVPPLAARRSAALDRFARLLSVGLLLPAAAACHHGRAPDSANTLSESPEAAETLRAEERTVPVVGFGPGGIELDYDASYVGSKECGECHVDHADSAQTHHMALTSGRVTTATRDRWFAPERLAQPVKWPRSARSPALRYRRDAGGVVLESRTPEGTGPHRARVAAVFGSGNRGFTPITVEDGGRMRELRLSYYHDRASWVMTPGSSGDPDPLGYVRSPEATRDCLGCHSTVLVFGEDRLDLDASAFGIGCERCHGPGSAHLDALERGDSDLRIFSPASLEAHDQARFCGQCHRRPADAEPHEVFRQAPSLARHAGAGLMLSACFRRSPPAEAISCLDCHDPHRNIDEERDDFDRPCLRCHDRPDGDHTSVSVADSSGCVRCHMPARTKGFFGLEFTSHWIRVPGRPPPGASAAMDEYADYLESSYRQAIAANDARGAEGVERASTLRMRLGKLLLGRGQKSSGLEWIRKALTFQPLYSDRALAAELHLRSGHVADATEILEEAVRTRPEYNRAYHALAHIHLEAGRFDQAKAVLEAWESARPGDPVLAETRSELESARRGKP